MATKKTKNAAAKKAAAKKPEKAVKKAADKKKKDPVMKVVKDDNVILADALPARKNGVEKKTKRKKEENEELPNIPKAITRAKVITDIKLITIKNKSKHLKIISSLIESDGSTPADDKEYIGRPIHPDLQAKFDAFKVHMGMICEIISVQHKKAITDYPSARSDRFVVQGVHIKTSKKGEGYIISGYLKLSDGKALIINTPKRLKDENDETRYAYMDDLVECVEALMEEVALYETGEKIGKVQQPEFGFPEDRKSVV